MTKEQYARMTGCVRSVTNRLPGGSKILRAPTLVCAAVYCMTLIYLMFTGDMRIIRAVLVPAACFLAATALRPAIGKQRPYDRFDTPPVGSYRPGQRQEHAQPPHSQCCRHCLRRDLCLSDRSGHRLHEPALPFDRGFARPRRSARRQRCFGCTCAEYGAFLDWLSALISVVICLNMYRKTLLHSEIFCPAAGDFFSLSYISSVTLKYR